MTQKLLEIDNLHVNIDNNYIIEGLNFAVAPGEVHAIMGKNGSGKSTLAKVIAGHPNYAVSQGNIIFNHINITQQDPEERAHQGIFLAFQYPIEIPGVSNADFLRLAYNSHKKSHNEPELDPLSFFDLISNKIKLIDMDNSFLLRNVNEGFSGGEKKKNEILQMSLLNSKLCILDEIDSGLDIDALKTLSKHINNIINENKAIIIITHYQRILDYIKPDYIHIMDKGKIVYTGDSSTAQQLEKYGYTNISQIKNM